MDLESGEFYDRLGCFTVDGDTGIIDGGLTYLSGLAARRTAATRSSFGLPAGFTANYTRRAQDLDTRIVLHTEYGRTITFEQTPAGDYRRVGANDLSMGRFDRTATGQLRLIHRNGSIETFSARGDLQSIANARGQLMTIKWYGIEGNDRRLVERIKDEGTGRLIERIYDKLTFGDGAAAVQQWRLVGIQDGVANRQGSQGAAPRVVRLNYPVALGGKLASITDEGGGVRSFEWDTNDLPKKRCDRNGKCVVNEFDTSGRVLSQAQPNGIVLAFKQASEPTHDLELQWSHPQRPEKHFQRFLHNAERKIIREYAIDSVDRFAERSYDASRRLTSETNFGAETTRYTRNAQTGDIETVSVGSAVWRFAEYDAFGTARQVTDPDGRVTVLQTNGVGQVQEVRAMQLGGTGAHTTRYEYGGRGRVRAVETPDGARTALAYDAAGHLDRVTLDERGLALIDEHTVDWRGLPMRRVGPDGVARSYLYNSRGFMNRAAVGPDSDPSVTTYEHDEEGNLKTIIRDDVQGGRREVWRIKHDVVGSTGYAVTEVTDPEGGVKKYGYDVLGRLERQTEVAANDDGSDRVTTWSYERRATGWRVTERSGAGTLQSVSESDDSGQLVLEQDARGVTTRYTYDEQGRLATQTTGDAIVIDVNSGIWPAKPEKTTFTYSPGGLLEKVTVGTGVTARVVQERSYDGYGRLASVRDGEGRVTTYAYDVASRTVTQTSGEGSEAIVSVSTYDAVGRRMASTTTPSAGTTLQERWAYEPSAAGDTNRWSLRNHSDKANVTRRFNYDARGNLRAVIADAGGPTETRIGLTFDRLGRLARQSLPLGLERAFTYQRLGMLAAVAETANGVTRTKRWRYRPHGVVSHEIDFDGTTTNYTYDALGRQIGIARGTATATTPEVQFEYLPNGLLSRMVDPLGTTEYGYDAQNTLAQRTRGGRTITYDRNLEAHSASVDLWGQSRHTMQYDRGDALASIELGGATGLETAGQAPSYRARYGIGSSGQLNSTTIDLGLGADVERTIFANRRVYDGAGRLAELQQSPGRHRPR